MSASVGICNIHMNMGITLEDTIIAETQMGQQSHGAILLQRIIQDGSTVKLGSVKIVIKVRNMCI